MVLLNNHLCCTLFYSFVRATVTAGAAAKAEATDEVADVGAAAAAAAKATDEVAVAVVPHVTICHLALPVTVGMSTVVAVEMDTVSAKTFSVMDDIILLRHPSSHSIFLFFGLLFDPDASGWRA